MSSDVLARLETLLQRVVTRRALPRVAAPVAAPVVATTPAPKAIAPEPVRPAARVEARRPEAAAAPVVELVVEPSPPVVEVVAAAPLPLAESVVEVVVEAPAPAAPVVAEAPKPVIELVVEAPAPTPPPAPPPPSPTSLPLPGPAKIVRADDRVAASFAAGAAVSPGFGDDDADHVETLAFRVGRALPKLAQVPAPPLPVTSRDEPAERRSERYTPLLPSTPVAAAVSDPAPRAAPASLRALLQRSVALRPRG